MSLSQIQSLVDKTGHWDKDERWMAVNDLCNILSGDQVKIDEVSEQKICNAVLKLLDDSSNEVQTVAVKCLSIVLKRAHQNQISDICDKLSKLIIDGSSALRDIYSICLKTLIADVPDGMGQAVVDCLTNRLIIGVGKSADEIKRESLDILTDLLKRFGYLLNEVTYAKIMESSLDQLTHGKAPIRKRASNCLGALAMVISDENLNRLINALLDRIAEQERGSRKVADSTTLIATIGVISRTVGYRLGKFLDRTIPLFIRFCGDPSDESMQNEAANELRESCFPGLESFVYRCPKEVAPFIPAILQVSTAFMKYDPNYSYDEDEEDGMDQDDRDADDEEYYDQDEIGSEDDDSSWKVRKAAVKVVYAIISAHSHLLAQLHSLCGDALLARFKEREENVRLDIIYCFGKLVEMNYSIPIESNESSTAAAAVGRGPVPLIRQRSTTSLLESRVDAIVKACSIQLSRQSTKSKIAVLQMLKGLMTALKGGLGGHFLKLARIVSKQLLEKDESIKLESLQFFRIGFSLHDVDVVLPCIDELLPMVSKLVRDDWHKTISEALRVIQAIIVTMRPIASDSNTFVGEFPYHKYVETIYGCVMTRLESLDVDLEIKECGLSCIGALFSHCGDSPLLVDKVPSLLSLLHKRVENETTRSATLKAICAIANSPASLDLSPFLASSARELSALLKQYSRSLKQLTIQTINALLKNASTTLDPLFGTAVIVECATLINDADLHLANHSLILVLTMLQKNPTATVESLVQHAQPRIMRLAKSPLLQGATTQSLIRLLQYGLQLSESFPVLNFATIFAGLYDIEQFVGEEGLPKQSIANVSKCVAGICSQLPSLLMQDAVSRFAKDSTSANDTVAQLALLCMAEVGTTTDLSSMPALKDAILSCFERPAEEVKLAAAYALGHISVGSMGTFLPMLLAAIATPSSARQQYLLLVALRETIITFFQLGLNFLPYLDAALPILTQQRSSEEESVRNMVSECLGVLTAIAPEQLVPLLLTWLSEDKRIVRVAVNALRSAVSKPLLAEALTVLSPSIERFLPLISESDLDIKKAALLMVNTAVHHNVSLISAYIPTVIFPALIQTLQEKMERVVDLGPFKHKVDDNLVLRKLSITCSESIISYISDKFDANVVMSIAPLLLADNDEVKLMFIQLLPRICRLSPGAVAIKVDEIIPAFEKIIADKTKESAEKGGKELVRASAQTILQLDKFEDVRNISRKWTEFVERLRKTPGTAEVIVSLESETIEGY